MYFKDLFINEATTLSKIGATNAQLKTVYSRKGDGKVLSKDSAYTLVNKAKATKLSNNEGDATALVGISKDGSLIIKYSNGYYAGYNLEIISPNGKQTLLQTDISHSAAMKHFKAGTSIYITDTALGRIQTVQDLHVKNREDNRSFFDSTVSKIKKEADVVFDKFKNDIKNEVENGNMSDAAAEQAMNLITTRRSGPRYGKMIGADDFTYWQMGKSGRLEQLVYEQLVAILSRESNPEYNNYSKIDDNKSIGTKPQIRQAGINALKEFKDTLKDLRSTYL